MLALTPEGGHSFGFDICFFGCPFQQKISCSLTFLQISIFVLDSIVDYVKGVVEILGLGVRGEGPRVRVMRVL